MTTTDAPSGITELRPSVFALSVVNVFDLAGAAAAPVAAPGFSEGVVRFPGVAGHKVAVGVGVLDVGVEATGAGVTAGAGAGADVGRQHRFATTLSVMVGGALALT